jgi:tetratricopeptide (TPR) repeat protein
MNKQLRTLSLVVTLLCALLLAPKATAQNSEKQNIINALNTEFESYQKRDKQTWSNAWVHSDKTRMTYSSVSWFYDGLGWDSLAANREKYFSMPVTASTNKRTRSDYDVTIKGNVAIVDFMEKDSLSNTSHTALLEKQGKQWKILRMTVLAKDSFKPTDVNVEAAINSQGYMLLQMKKIDEAIKLFALNTQLFPNAWNVWDSLAEAYMLKGENDIATGYYKKSMQLNPENDNGQKMLDILAKK